MDRLWVHFRYIWYSPSSHYYVTNNSMFCLVNRFWLYSSFIGALKNDEWLTYGNWILSVIAFVTLIVVIIDSIIGNWKLCSIHKKELIVVIFKKIYVRTDWRKYKILGRIYRTSYWSVEHYFEFCFVEISQLMKHFISYITRKQIICLTIALINKYNIELYYYIYITLKYIF